MTAEGITLPAPQVPVMLGIRSSTALAFCTTIVPVAPEGAARVVRDWPRLSSGEELLWQVLAAVGNQGAMPSEETLRAGLDVENYRAIQDALAAQVPA